MEESSNKSHHEPWNKGKLVGQKAPFKLKDIWAIRVRLQLEHRVRELAMFDLGLDSKLPVMTGSGCTTICLAGAASTLARSSSNAMLCDAANSRPDAAFTRL